LRTRPRTSRYEKLFLKNVKLMTGEISNFTRTFKKYSEDDKEEVKG